MKSVATALVSLSLLVGAASTRADETELVATARRVAGTYGPSIVNITAVAKISQHASAAQLGGGEGREQNTSSVGTIIDPSGLLVTSLSSVDPAAMLPTIKMNVPGAGDTSISFTSEIHDLKYRLTDGTEIPARIVVKDEDLDLAFIAPSQPLDDATKAKLVPAPLTDAAPDAAVADATIVLGRTDKSLSYTASLNLGRISACIVKPRRCYRGDGEPGSMVFNAQGKVLGLIVIHTDHASVVNPTMLMGRQSMHAPPIILPIAEVNALVAQARQEAGKSAPATAPAAAADPQK